MLGIDEMTHGAEFEDPESFSFASDAFLQEQNRAGRCQAYKQGHYQRDWQSNGERSENTGDVEDAL
jgi:hypothetical protein